MHAVASVEVTLDHLSDSTTLQYMYLSSCRSQPSGIIFLDDPSTCSFCWVTTNRACTCPTNYSIIVDVILRSMCIRGKGRKDGGADRIKARSCTAVLLSTLLQAFRLTIPRKWPPQRCRLLLTYCAHSRSIIAAASNVVRLIVHADPVAEAMAPDLYRVYVL